MYEVIYRIDWREVKLVVPEEEIKQAMECYKFIAKKCIGKATIQITKMDSFMSFEEALEKANE